VVDSAAVVDYQAVAEHRAAGKRGKRMIGTSIIVLYVNESEAEYTAVQKSLLHFESVEFKILWKKNAEEALEYLATQPVDVIITEDVLPGMNGFEFVRRLKDLKYDIPIVFLTLNKDVSLAVEVMRLGVKDYMLRDDVASHIFPQSLLRIVEKNRLLQELTELEIKQKRLEAMQKIVLGISDKISEPLTAMGKVVVDLEQSSISEKALKYLKLIKDNVDRMQMKLEKLQNLKEDKTVKYIRDIKMIDLS